jgi:hypothetical protein
MATAAVIRLAPVPAVARAAAARADDRGRNKAQALALCQRPAAGMIERTGPSLATQAQTPDPSGLRRVFGVTGPVAPVPDPAAGAATGLPAIGAILRCAPASPAQEG